MLEYQRVDEWQPLDYQVTTVTESAHIWNISEVNDVFVELKSEQWFWQISQESFE